MSLHALRPGFDPQVEPVLKHFPPFDPERLAIMRDRSAAVLPSTLVDDGTVTVREHEVATTSGVVRLLAYRPAAADGALPLIYRIHGGGLIVGNRFSDAPELARWAVACDAVVTSVEYRLAPEHPYPAALEDCYAGLVWAARHAERLGADPRRIVVAGGSAGGHLAAATAIAARDRRGPVLLAQLLMAPMLDDRAATASAAQFDDAVAWGGAANRFGWLSHLGALAGGTEVPPTAAPARLADFSGLPSAYLDCGSAELFRDETVAYASALWAGGVQAELHIWPGGFHGFDSAVPDAEISVACRAARLSWLRRTLVCSAGA